MGLVDGPGDEAREDLALPARLGKLAHHLGEIGRLLGRMITNQPQGGNPQGQVMAFEGRDAGQVDGIVFNGPVVNSIMAFVEKGVLMTVSGPQADPGDQGGLALGIAEKDHLRLGTQAANLGGFQRHLVCPLLGLPVPAELEQQVRFRPAQGPENGVAVLDEILEITDDHCRLAKDHVGRQGIALDELLDELGGLRNHGE
jgi:hypothetical protein